MIYMGISPEERYADYISSSALLKWAARMAALAFMFSLFSVVYNVLGQKSLSELESTKADLDASLRSSEIAARACLPIEAAANRVAQMRPKLEKVFSLHPALAALSEALEPGVCLEKFELLSSDCTPDILSQSGLETEAFSVSECLYRIRLSLYAHDLQAAGRYVGAFCGRASSMYGGFFEFLAISLEEGEEAVFNGESYRIYGVNIDVKASDGGNEDGRK